MSVWYNENAAYPAQWLRNLVVAGHLPAGIVDERSIRDVRPDELRGHAQCHFFAGIGGWPLALRLAGWPDELPVWTGSCPCQPWSRAGKRRGSDDERHPTNLRSTNRRNGEMKNLCGMTFSDVEAYVKQLEQRLAAVDGNVKDGPSAGQYVIVRARDAGVHAGVLVSRDKDTVKLMDSRRLWLWWSQFTLSELAKLGVRKDKVSECKFGVPLPSIEICGWCEIIPCSDDGERTIRAVPNANEK